MKPEKQPHELTRGIQTIGGWVGVMMIVGTPVMAWQEISPSAGIMAGLFMAVCLYKHNQWQEQRKAQREAEELERYNRKHNRRLREDH